MKGLYSKYIVISRASGEVVEDCFVLRPVKDPAARAALRAYSGETSDVKLAGDLLSWVQEIEDQP